MSYIQLPTSYIVQMWNIKLRQKGLLRIKEINSPDDTTPELDSSRPVKDLSPELKSIESAEWVLFLKPLESESAHVIVGHVGRDGVLI